MILNFILFQVAWFACVAGAAAGKPFLGVVVTFFVLLWHLYQAKQYKIELKLILSVLITGATFDQMMLSFHFIEYAHHGWGNSVVPVWILALWLGFATTLNASLAWMQGKAIVAVLFGAVGGPLAYLGAQKLGAVVLPGFTSYIVLSIGWAVLTPCFLIIARHFNGYQNSSQESKP